jgi:hypothetical protein
LVEPIGETWWDQYPLSLKLIVYFTYRLMEPYSFGGELLIAMNWSVSAKSQYNTVRAMINNPVIITS